MSEHETVGDEIEVACPWCGKDQAIQDYHTDDCLKEGLEFECEDCQKKIVITGVDYSVTVTADRKETTAGGDQRPV